MGQYGELLGMPLDVTARKIRVTASRLQELKSGRSLPTMKQLRTIAKIHRHPTAFFYLKTLPPTPEQIQDFRALRGHYNPEPA